MNRLQRKRLEDAMVASFIENADSAEEEFYHDFVKATLRGEYRGYAQMTDEELLNAAKADIGYDPPEEYLVLNDNSTDKMRELGQLITEIEKEN